ncbi:2Fe-2S iron-sulfur cluster-binding protein [Burkholderia sp. KCJ3K979]|uniref:2Fe-2S iron-sulfur cluster-binding protein n=1 Tax=Burkholderia sp. KCJ3K979 TaxID=2759149 RepID=UPI002351EA39|nr:2Fe-2S iron-sulfur cluster-binding protein [Burkholderia sp. KCJ3K979]
MRTRQGRAVAVESPDGVSLMEAIRASGMDEILALCGGCLSCATCHVYIDPAFENRLPPMSDDEAALLDTSTHRNEHSRLSCQIVLTSDLDGLRATVAPED